MRLTDVPVLALEGLREATGRRRAPAAPAPAPAPREAEAICACVVAACWNGRYLQAGQGHLDQFWLRDLAISLEGLIDLGLAERCRRSLRWALAHWERAGRITTTIFLQRHPVDIYAYACDSLPLLLRALERLGMDGERLRHRGLLAREAHRYRALVWDGRRRQVRGDRMFSAVKDTTDFRATCYAHGMAALLAELLLRAPELPDVFAGEDLRGRLMELYWTGEFFRNHLDDGPPLISADANFFPYFLGLVDDPWPRFARSLAAVRAEGLDRPFPLKYHARRFPGREVALQRLFLPNYQGDAIWTFFACPWIEMVARVDPAGARRYLAQYEAWLARWGTWIEVFAPDGCAPLRGRFGHGSCWGMLWAANFPRLKRLLGPTP